MTPVPMFERLNHTERRTMIKAMQIAERYMVNSGDFLNSPDAVAQYLRLQYAGDDRERFRVIFLNAQLRLIAAEEITTGTLAQTAVYPREVARRALFHNAASVILVHNHPSGNVTPSKCDIELTERIRKALATLDIQVTDHFIVAGRSVISIREFQALEKRLPQNQQPPMKKNRKAQK